MHVKDKALALVSLIILCLSGFFLSQGIFRHDREVESMIAKEEEEGFVTDFKESAGGSAANTVVGLARLELKTGFIGKVAADHEGKLLLDDFRKEKVDTNGITISKEGRSGVVQELGETGTARRVHADLYGNCFTDIKRVVSQWIECVV